MFRVRYRETISISACQSGSETGSETGTAEVHESIISVDPVDVDGVVALGSLDMLKCVVPFRYYPNTAVSNSAKFKYIQHDVVYTQIKFGYAGVFRLLLATNLSVPEFNTLLLSFFVNNDDHEYITKYIYIIYV